jgi:threonine dehydratase
MPDLKFADFLTAQRRLRPYLNPTPLETAPALGASIYLKLENLNPTHSFKIRGALNATVAQADSARERGIVAASAGNHAMGVAYGAALAGAKATIVMPIHTPQRKIKGVERHGAHIILRGTIYDEAEHYAHQLERERGELFISPYNDPYVIAGQGTISLEIFEGLPTVKRILVPASGGGLLAGVAMAARHINPDVEIIGVQSSATPAMYNEFYGTQLPQLDTVADGLSGEIEVGSITIPLCKTYTHRILLVEEPEIVEAIRWMFREHGWVIEGAAAVGVAALLTNKIEAHDQATVVIISGGNIDADKFLRLMHP